MTVACLDKVATVQNGETDVPQKNVKVKPPSFLQGGQRDSLKMWNWYSHFPAQILSMAHQCPLGNAQISCHGQPVSLCNRLSPTPGYLSSLSKDQLHSPCLPLSDVTLSPLPTSWVSRCAHCTYWNEKLDKAACVKLNVSRNYCLSNRCSNLKALCSEFPFSQLTLGAIS